jgi:iron complex transport system substrate-binding protein
MTLPTRLICLTEEPTEVLYALGEQHRIVGISGFTVRPPQARQEKPRVSAFTSAKIDRILELKPDLAIGFSDMQADIARALILAGVEVWISNHRTVAGILGYVRRLGAMVGAAEKAEAYAQQLQAHVEAVRAEAALLPRRPRVYFEEWDEPSISAIRWVSELITIAGGDDIFPERAAAPLGRDRIVADRAESRGARAGHHHRLLVRQEVPPPSRWPRGRAGRSSPPCATASCTRSSRR